MGLTLTVRPSLGLVLLPQSQSWHDPQSELTFPYSGYGRTYLHFDNYFVDRQRLAAEWLEQHAPKDAVVAATPAGSIAYHTHLRVIDMLGLNDVHIAHTANVPIGWHRAGHEKGDGRYVLSRAPDFILLGNVAVLSKALTEADMARKLVRTSEHEIWADPAFHRDYELVTVQLEPEGMFRYFSFYKKRTLHLARSFEARHTQYSLK